MAENESQVRARPAGAIRPSDAGRLAFLETLARALEERDARLRLHAQRVGFYADALAEALGLDDESRTLIRTASILHDIGRISLREPDMQRAGLSDPGEFTRAIPHSEFGARVVRALGFEEPVAEAVRHHHEHWDGAGEPSGLKCDEIPLASRIIHVVDAFDRLTAAPPGSRSLDADQAAVELKKRAGSCFDPELSSRFVTLLENGAFEVQAAGTRA